MIVGVDEAGRGPLAGPVVAAAVILPRKGRPKGLDDSKQMSAEARERMAEKRGSGAAHDTLSAVDLQVQQEATDLVALDDLLNRLEANHPRSDRKSVV